MDGCEFVLASENKLAELSYSPVANVKPPGVEVAREFDSMRHYADVITLRIEELMVCIRSWGTKTQNKPKQRAR